MSQPGDERVQSEKMAAIGRLAAGVAHEINNPASFVLANLEAMAGLLEDVGERIEANREAARQLGIGPTLFEAMTILHESKEGMARIYRIVRELRTFARADDDATAQIEVNAAIESALLLTRNELRYRAVIERDLRARAFTQGSVSRLGQVLVNLILNAADALRDREPEQARIVLHTRDEDGWVILEVRDNGCGIPLEIQARIFDAFFTTKPHGQGTGLGLAISRDLVRAMGGDITVESAPGRGATFRVRLPALDQPQVVTPPPAPTRQRRATGTRGRVLAIDDEVLLLKAYRRMLIDHHDVVTQPSAVEALKLLEEDRAFDVVLCDLQMPGMSGAQLHETVRARWPELVERFVFVTGGAFTPETRRFLDRGGITCINKPFQLGELLALFERRLRGSTVAAVPVAEQRV